MLSRVIYSIGIDIGTSTTEVIISRLKLKNSLNTSMIMETEITDKKIIYKSQIMFTPLVKNFQIDFKRIQNIIIKALNESRVSKEEIATGAVIVTGESARKENAHEVSKNLSQYLGDFVVATAGPKLEALLSGYGAGAAEFSKKLSRRIINLDIGGGTTNISVFDCGKCEQTYALDIGGRLIKFNDEEVVTYISPRIQFIIKNMNLNIKLGEKIILKELHKLCVKLSQCLLEACCLNELSHDTKKLFITEELEAFRADYICFSGGVSEYICEAEINMNLLKLYNDIGPLLGNCIKKEFKKYESMIIDTKEKIRATVIGAGNYSLNISGSTIFSYKTQLPIKNVPIVKFFEDEEDFNDIYSNGKKKLSMYEDEEYVAVSLKGPQSPTYEELKLIAMQIIKLFEENNRNIIVIIENDFAKALGQVIKLNLFYEKSILCIDRIATDNGDYIDIGAPIGNAIPVVIKTLIYNC